MSNQTRQSLIQTAAELFERQGYHGTSLNQIVQESDTPRGSLYYYFAEGKEELAAAAIEAAGKNLSEQMRRQLSRREDPIEAIYQYLMELADRMEAESCAIGAPLATVTLEAPSTSEWLRSACQAAYAELFQAIYERLVAGKFTPERASSLAMLILATMEGSIILARARKNSDPIRVVANEIRAL